jgi:hypothetical protein
VDNVRSDITAGLSTDDVATASSTVSLRLHTDRLDDLLGITHVTVVQSNDTSGGRFCADVPQSIRDMLEQQVAGLPDGMLRLKAASPRQPQAGVVSSRTLRRLPQRAATASVMAGALTRCTAFCLVHWVTNMLTN